MQYNYRNIYLLNNILENFFVVLNIWSEYIVSQWFQRLLQPLDRFNWVFRCLENFQEKAFHSLNTKLLEWSELKTNALGRNLIPQSYFEKLQGVVGSCWSQAVVSSESRHPFKSKVDPTTYTNRTLILWQQHHTQTQDKSGNLNCLPSDHSSWLAPLRFVLFSLSISHTFTDLRSQSLSSSILILILTHL